MQSSKQQLELPDWFALNKYDFTSDLECWQWAYLLQQRRNFRWELEYLKRAPKQAAQSNRAEEALKEIAEDLDKLGNGASFGAPATQPEDVVFRPWEMKSTVDPLSIGALGDLWSYLRIDKEFSRFEKNLQEDISPRSFFEAREYWAFLKLDADEVCSRFREEPLEWDEDDHLHTLINIGASEEQLIEDFRKYIQMQKAKFRLPCIPERKFGRSQRRKWFEQRVLPYLDIVLWCEYTQTQITQQKIGTILFPEDIDISLDERIRKTIKPLAKMLTSSSFLYALSNKSPDDGVEPE